MEQNITPEQLQAYVATQKPVDTVPPSRKHTILRVLLWVGVVVLSVVVGVVGITLINTGIDTIGGGSLSIFAFDAQNTAAAVVVTLALLYVASVKLQSRGVHSVLLIIIILSGFYDFSMLLPVILVLVGSTKLLKLI
jgi:magnesium-transporting ATPase (P-type)